MIAQLTGDMFGGLWIVLLFWATLLVALIVLIAFVTHAISKRRGALREQREWLARKRTELEVDPKAIMPEE